MAQHHRNLNSALHRIALALACALAFTFLAPPRAANAQDAFSCIEELSDDEVSYRIRYIEDDMQKGKKHATRWRYTWMGMWLAAGGVSTWLAVKAARDDRQWDKFGWAYLAAGSYFAAATHAFMPAPDVWGAKRIKRQDDSTAEARRAKLLYATQTLKQAAEVQTLNSGALGIATSLIYGVVGGTVKATLWKGLSRGLTAGVYVAPVLLTGLENATGPRGAMHGYEAYRGIACSSKYYDRTEEGADYDFSVSPAGGSFTISF